MSSTGSSTAYAGTTGTPAVTAISRAASLRPICSITRRRGADELDPGRLHGARERGPLGEEAVARVDRRGAGRAGGGDDLVDVEVAADAHRVVGLADVRGAVVEVGVDRDAAHAEGAAAADHPQRDLAAVGDEDGLDHG